MIFWDFQNFFNCIASFPLQTASHVLETAARCGPQRASLIRLMNRLGVCIMRPFSLTVNTTVTSRGEREREVSFSNRWNYNTCADPISRAIFDSRLYRLLQGFIHVRCKSCVHASNTYCLGKMKRTWENWRRQILCEITYRNCARSDLTWNISVSVKQCPSITATLLLFQSVLYPHVTISIILTTPRAIRQFHRLQIACKHRTPTFLIGFK
jgi:hypothetical protein